MPSFPTPELVSLRFKLTSGEIRIEASARQDTEVDVRPSNPKKSEDLEAAAHTVVDHRDGTVVIEAPDERRSFGRSGSIDVRVALPEGSHLRGAVASADVYADGSLGEVEVSAASGDVHVEQASALTIQTASGDVLVTRVGGDAKIQTASGDVSLNEASGNATVSTASGDAQVGSVGGDVRLQAASGDVNVRTVAGSVEAKTASGDVKVGSVQRGEVSADAASGDIEIGIATGVAVWLDVTSLSGDVRSSLDQSGEPDGSEETVSVRARSLSGDISIVRAR